MARDPKAPTQPFYTVKEVAARMRLSEYVIRAAIRRGTIPGQQIGRSYRIPVWIFEAWLSGILPLQEPRNEGWSGEDRGTR